MNEVLLKEKRIESMIYEIRGVQVMLDFDLAKLYQCKNGTKSINLAVKRNINRFPERFMFQLTEEETKNLRFQIETKKTLIETRGGKYNKPYAFTEQGVAMLITILRTPLAEEISIEIMDAFVTMRKYIGSNLLEQKYINNQVFKNTENIKLLQESFDKFSDKSLKNEIYFDGQIYDTYSKIIDIMSEAKKELIIIDAYADKTVLDMISKIKVSVTLITRNNKLSKLDIEKYNSQYNNLKIIYDDTFHDRYLVLDSSIVYHCGTSLNHAGSKTFSINKIEDGFVKKSLINKINSNQT